jgi:hypothetical protein
MRVTWLPLAASFFVGACDLGPSVSGTVEGVRPDGGTYRYKFNCKLAGAYATPSVKSRVSIPNVGSGDLSIDNAILQQTDNIFRALDFAQFNACQDAMTKGGDSQLYALVKTALDQYSSELAQARNASEVQSANQKARTVLAKAAARGASTPEPAETPEARPAPDNSDVSADNNADNAVTEKSQTVVVRATPRHTDD